MKNPEGNIGEVYFGRAAEKALLDESDKKNLPMTKAERYVELKVVQSEIVPNYDGTTTYGQLFSQTKRAGESLPADIADAIDFKKWYLSSMEEQPRKAA